MTMTFTVAIVGRPNVGKSTLFNRLVGRRVALVDDKPGVTRDRRYGTSEVAGRDCCIIDTAGLEEVFDGSLEARMRRQTEQAVAESDLVFFLIDARAGITPLDEHFAGWLRRVDRKVVVLANKCEGRASESGVIEAFGLGFGEPLPVSAEHGLGVGEIHDAIARQMADQAKPGGNGLAQDDAEEDPGEDAENTRALSLAIVGRPNVGKSTLINRLIGEERLLTGPEAGITRDAISIDWEYRGRRLRLVDTAGLRKRARVVEKVEKLSAADSFRSLRFAEVVVLLLDAEAAMERQDLTIARSAVDEGRALVIGLNKWDRCANREATLRLLNDRLTRSLPQTRGIPVVPLSALQGDHLDRLMTAVFTAYRIWNQRIPTAKLNRWLEAVTQAHPPPAPAGRRIRLKYITQAKARPPTFAIFSSNSAGLSKSYMRYLENALREDFNLPGTPIRIFFRESDNPYSK
jgi:GTP-binding protein